MPAKKTKKFGMGGMLATDPSTSVPSSMQSFMGGATGGGSSGSSASAGLDQLAAGTETVNQAVQSASNALTGSGVQGSLGSSALQGSAVYKKGGAIKKYTKGGSVNTASRRADGCATKGKTKGRMV
jgi:hypothetical protein